MRTRMLVPLRCLLGPAACTGETAPPAPKVSAYNMRRRLDEHLYRLEVGVIGWDAHADDEALENRLRPLYRRTR